MELLLRLAVDLDRLGLIVLPGIAAAGDRHRQGKSG
jgi:hypothetical protein